MDERPGSDTIGQLAEALGIGIMVQSLEPGSPVKIIATFLLDTRAFDVTATGPTEDEAWKDLSRRAIEWKNHDERNVRNWFGGV
jgi:hypothetical protein